MKRRSGLRRFGLCCFTEPNRRVLGIRTTGRGVAFWRCRFHQLAAASRQHIILRLVVKDFQLGLEAVTTEERRAP